MGINLRLGVINPCKTIIFSWLFGVQGPKLSKNHAQEHFKKHTCLGEYALSSTSIMGIMPSWHLLAQVWHLHGAYGMIAVRGVLFLFPFRVSENILPCGIDELLGDGFKYFYFHPYLEKWSNLTNIFQMGCNHQLICRFESSSDPWVFEIAGSVDSARLLVSHLRPNPGKDGCDSFTVQPNGHSKPVSVLYDTRMHQNYAKLGKHAFV